MNGVLTRLLVVLAIVALAALSAWLISRFARPPHPSVVVGDLGDRPGVVLFTSTTCSSCKEAIGLLEDLSIPFREVTTELEPSRFDDWGVVAVPLTVVVDRSGDVVASFTGVPRRRSLRRALSLAGVSRT